MFNIGQVNLPTVMQHSFSNVPQADIPRSSFRRTFGHKTTFDTDLLIPIFVDEVLPGDTFNVSMASIVRMITPLTPFMDNLYLDTFFFFVPNRLLWDNWQKFCGEQVNPDDSTDYVIPYMDSTSGTGYSNETLHDYFGLPTLVPDLRHSSLWHRGYNLIWNEWFRDQNLQDSLVVNTGDGPDDPTDYVLQKRGKRHDYFTSCLPWPQKGTAVDLPLGQQADVIFPSNLELGNVHRSSNDASYGQLYSQNNTGYLVHTGAGNNFQAYLSGAGPTDAYADLSTADGVTINALRESFQIQKMLERDARGGTRYTEILRSHFGVTSPDARLQRPEYLGGTSSPFIVSPLAQTSETSTTELGTLAATATSIIRKHGFVKSFVEHGVIIGLACVRADLTYQQGLPRMFSRSTRYDFYWPALAHLGEQEVLNKEIYAQGSANPAEDAEVFGYQERWAEYRYKPSMITGKMRSNDAQSLDIWHLSEDFSSLPALNSTFIKQNTPIDRVTAVADEPQFKADFYFDFKAARPIPTYSVPGLIDHF